MSHASHKYIMFTFLSLLLGLPSSSSLAGIGFSSSSNHALSVSSSRSENKDSYLIEIDIEGMPTSQVVFKTEDQTLYLSAVNSGAMANNSSAGAQVISLAFNFPVNAKLDNYLRVNKPNKIMISVPKG